jgi:hypothetical protein
MRKIEKALMGALVGLMLLPLGMAAQTAEEIVASHVKAIGVGKNQDGIKTLIATGLSEFESNSPVVKGGGKAIVVSNPENLFWVISLNSKEYPFEKVGYFSGKANLPFVNAGNRSLLGVFLKEHDALLSEGLFGGAMTLRWKLLGGETRKSKMKLAGNRKVDDRKAFMLEYLTGGSEDFKIRIFIDLRTEYSREVNIASPTFGRQNQIANARLTLTEEFGDFKTVENMTLPYRYRVTFTSNSNTSINTNIWGIRVAQYFFNRPLTDDFFTFEPKTD